MLLLWLVLIFYLILLSVKMVPATRLCWDAIGTTALFQGTAKCKSSSQCKSSEVCLQEECVPKYRGGASECNIDTGDWVVVRVADKSYAKCVCKYPHLISQAWDGGNCNVSKACGPHGRLEDVNRNPILYGRCTCDEGYYADGLECRKLLPYQQFHFSCTSDEMTRSEARSVFTKEYLNSVPSTVQCFKRPCSFNVLNGKPLKYNVHDPKYGCICDPSRGNFGVVFQNEKYLKSDGYHACGNIFENEPDHDVRVKLYTYFYVKNMDPISFLHFDKLKKDSVVKALRDHVTKRTIQIGEDWRFGYAQYVFREKDYYVHSRSAWTETAFNIRKSDENLMLRKHMTDCQDITKHVVQADSLWANTYRLLYNYPVCYFVDPKTPKYHDAYVLNPFLLSFKEYPTLERSNGFVMVKYMLDSWYVDLAENNLVSHATSAHYPILADDAVRSILAR